MLSVCTRAAILRAFASILAGALIPAVFLFLINPDPRAIASFFVSCLAYSTAIGGLANIVIPLSWPFQTALRPLWKWAFRLGLLLGLAVVGTLLACVFLMLIGIIRPAGFWQSYAMDLRIAIFVTLMVGTGFSVFESMRVQLEQSTLDLRTKELERERALKLATEAKLSSLESRLHPHFLFNSLNSISALIQDDPQRAERLVERMAALLRFSLDSAHRGLVPLDQELKIVADYLEIERARYGERLRYAIHVANGAGDLLVPPLAVQTLVENSVKYAIAPSRPGGEIHIEGGRIDGRLRVAVSDTGPGFNMDAVVPGHGLDNLKSRLAALFGSAACLQLDHRPGSSTVSLLIPQNGTRA